jgi:hypothetical protein
MDPREFLKSMIVGEKEASLRVRESLIKLKE